MSFTTTVILQIIIFYCLVMAFQKSPTLKSLRFCAISIPIVIALFWYLLPRYALAVALGLWLPLIVLPSLLMRRLNSLLQTAEFDRARRFAEGLRWLMPTDGMWVYPQVLRGMALWQKGEHAAAEELLSRYRSDRRMMPRTAISLSYRMANRWPEYIAWADGQSGKGEVEIDRSATGIYYLRAIGEIGDLSRLLAILARFPHRQDLLISRLQALALCGQTEAVAKIAPHALHSFPVIYQEFWLGTAEMAAGQNSQRLNYLQSTGGFYLEQDLKWRLANPLPDLKQLSVVDWENVKILENATMQEIEQGQQIPDQAATPATNILIWLNIGIFVAEAGWKILSTTTQLPWLSWGGLYAPLAIGGEWWRLITANFLHINLIHLLMNMLGLSFLGKFVEHRLGTIRFIIAYILTGLGSMVCITYVDLWQAAPRLTAGASGAIMGLLGVMGAIYLVSWLRQQTATASRELKSIGVGVGLQLIFDITNGQTSIVGHFSGLAIGFVVGMLLTTIKR